MNCSDRGIDARILRICAYFVTSRGNVSMASNNVNKGARDFPPHVCILVTKDFGFCFVFVLFDLLHKPDTTTIDNYAVQLQVYL